MERGDRIESLEISCQGTLKENPLAVVLSFTKSPLCLLNLQNHTGKVVAAVRIFWLIRGGKDFSYFLQLATGSASICFSKTAPMPLHKVALQLLHVDSNFSS